MLASIFSLNVIQTALELGCIYALVALALFLSYSILNIADLSTDGCFTLGCAVACQVALTGHPFLALAAAMAAGVCSGFVTAFLQTRLGVESIMAGIIVNTGLYTINLAVMGFSSTMSLVKKDTVFSLAKSALAFTGGWYKLVLAVVVIALAGAAMVGFLGTRLGLSIRATGDNAAMVRASSINPAFTITVGHRTGFPHHRRDAGGQAHHGAPGAGRGVRQLPVPLHRGGGPAVQCPGSGHEAGERHHRGGGHLHARHPVPHRL